MREFKNKDEEYIDGYIDCLSDILDIYKPITLNTDDEYYVLTLYNINKYINEIAKHIRKELELRKYNYSI